MKAFSLKFTGEVVDAAFASFDLSLLALLLSNNTLMIWDVKESSVLVKQIDINKWSSQVTKLKWDIEDSNRILVYSKNTLLIIDIKHPGNEMLIQFDNSLTIADAFFISKYPKRKS